jgi:hypothetical protein
MRSQYNVKRSSFIPVKYHHFSTQSPSILMHLSHHGMSLKIPSLYKSGSFIHNIQQRPFALLNYCAIGDRPSVASEAQTDGSLMGQGQDYRTIGL